MLQDGTCVNHGGTVKVKLSALVNIKKKKKFTQHNFRHDRCPFNIRSL